MKTTKLWVLAFACGLFFAKTADADRALLFPLEVVNTPADTADAVTLVLSRHMESRGLTVVMGKDLNLPVTGVNGEGTPASSTPPPSSGAAAGSAAATGSTVAAPASPSVVATGTGCRFYLTGSIVTLGEQTAITLDLFLANGARISGKKITAQNMQMLPGAVETIAVAAADDMRRFQEAPSKAEAEGAPVPAPASARPKYDEGFQKNFGILVGQTFSVSKSDMYDFMSFYFNARLEFNRLLMNTNVGFSLGNKDPGDAAHFLFNLSVSGYLLKTQVTPYLGGGVGFFIGNRMKDCDRDYLGNEICGDGDAHVGWDVFPVVGLEVLRTMFLRVHLEGRYLVTVNGYGSWGHGPAILMGIAF